MRRCLPSHHNSERCVLVGLLCNTNVALDNLFFGEGFFNVGKQYLQHKGFVSVVLRKCKRIRGVPGVYTSANSQDGDYQHVAWRVSLWCYLRLAEVGFRYPVVFFRTR